MTKRELQLEFKLASERLASSHPRWKTGVCPHCSLPAVIDLGYGDFHPLCWNDPERQKKAAKAAQKVKQSETLF
jgi:hypothetical protein